MKGGKHTGEKVTVLDSHGQLDFKMMYLAKRYSSYKSDK